MTVDVIEVAPVAFSFSNVGRSDLAYSRETLAISREAPEPVAKLGNPAPSVRMEECNCA